MSKIFYISDLHLMHQNIIRFDNRPFKTVEEMDKALIDNWNSVVSNADHVYHLGDFCWGKKDDWIKYLKLLNGNIHIINGNHDLKEFSSDVRKYIVEAVDYKEITDNGRHVILCHYPIMCYNGQYRLNENGEPKTYMLYGHVHDTRDELLIDRFIRITKQTSFLDFEGKEKTIPCCMINCFCVFSDYAPLTLDEWIENDQMRRKYLSEEFPA